MGPLYYAGTADQIKMCIDQIRAALPEDVMDYIQNSCNVQPNPTAGSPELSKAWNECIAAVQYLADSYKK